MFLIFFKQNKFLCNIPPTNFNESTCSQALLQQKMHALIYNDNNSNTNSYNNKIFCNTPTYSLNNNPTSNNSNNNSPNNTINILDCCIKSYFSIEKKKMYRIFDTILNV